jgi:hypothetical protein
VNARLFVPELACLASRWGSSRAAVARLCLDSWPNRQVTERIGGQLPTGTYASSG